jgi:EAL domain-containing protein (putative c-di-GMP-specific phosphodiesterase class I)/GGDEF domain-containing protein
VLMLAFIGSFVLNTLSIQRTLAEELATKNTDNATVLALSMSQLQKDSVTLELLISSQFDSGQYQYIGLFDPNGNLITERKNTAHKTIAPSWFTKLYSINVHPGLADVQDNWKQYGRLHVKSDVNFAYDKLWNTMIYMGVFAILIGLLGYYLCGHFLKKILDPLDTVINQAKAIELHQFITTDEPDTQELRTLVRAMNSLSNLVKKMLHDESIRLEELSKKINLDPVTGLMRRDYFLDHIQSSTHHDDNFDSGPLVVFRLVNLADIDKALDYKRTNALLKRLGDSLVEASKNNPALITCRLKGADFAIFGNQPIDELVLANQLKSTLESVVFNENVGIKANFLIAIRKIKKFDNSTNLISLVNDLLNSTREYNSFEFIINANDIPMAENVNLRNTNSLNWGMMLNDALVHNRLKLEHFPVITSKYELLHFESYVRIQLSPDEKWLSAAEFMFWATQFSLVDRIDELVLESAIGVLNENHSPLCVHVSSQAMLNEAYIKKAKKLIKKSLRNPNQLCFEINEATAFNHIEEFKYFCREIKMLGCAAGVEHISHHIARLSELNGVSLDYIKVNSIHVSGINSNQENQELLKGLCSVAHSMGLLAIAEGVRSDDEIKVLIDIGIDGMTGPAIKLPYPKQTAN